MLRTHTGSLVITRVAAWTPTDGRPISQTPLGFNVAGIRIDEDGTVVFQTKDPLTGKLDPAVTMELRGGVWEPVSPEIILDTGTDPTTVFLGG